VEERVEKRVETSILRRACWIGSRSIPTWYRRTLLLAERVEIIGRKELNFKILKDLGLIYPLESAGCPGTERILRRGDTEGRLQ